MGNPHNPHGDEHASGDPMDPSAGGKTAGSNTQSQGGISHKVVEAAHADYDPGAGLPGGPLGGSIDPPPLSIEQGDGPPHDGWAHHGFSGDNGPHEPTDSGGTPASLQPGLAADLGAQKDQRLHGMPRDPAERTTGADTPNQGGIAGSPGGPHATVPRHIPGEDPDKGTRLGGQSDHYNQRDPQI